MTHKTRLFCFSLAIGSMVMWNSSTWAIDVFTFEGNGLDAEASETADGPGGEVTYGLNGTKDDMNARYNGYNNGLDAGVPEAEGGDPDNDDRNEFWVMRFDLSNQDKSQIADAAIRVTAMRDDNLQKDLRIWGVNPDALNANTFTETSTFADVPGLFEDFDMTTLSVDSSETTYLGDFLFPNFPGEVVPLEGDLLTINQDVLDNTGPNGTSEPDGGGVLPQSTLDGFLRSLGPTDMATFLVGGVASNGQVRVGTKEATQTSTGVFQCPNGECAPFLRYELSEGTAGDFNSDSIVDGRDFLAWQRGESPDPLSTNDLSDWQNNYGAGAISGIAAIPEPSSALLLVGCTLCLLGGRTRSKM